MNVNKLNPRQLEKQEINNLVSTKFPELFSAVSNISSSLFDLSMNDRILVDAFLRINASQIKPNK